MAGRRVVVAGNRTTLSKEMCHEEIHRALALISLIAIPSLTATANAAPVSPSSPAFGSNGY
jgi:hypothetical protein